jgi:uncharacterized membrane protein
VNETLRDRLGRKLLRNSSERTGTGVFQLHRLESLTDGIYAFSMTLLVLSIPMPEPGQKFFGNWELLSHLLDLDDVFLTFVTSFVLLGVLWITQQKLFRHLTGTCTTHLWASLGGLMMVCLIPFSSMQNGEYGDLFVSDCFFHINILLLSVFLALQWGVAIKHPEIVQEGTEQKLLSGGFRISLVLPMLSLVGILVAIFWPAWSTLVYVGTPFAIAKVRYGDRRKCG